MARGERPLEWGFTIALALHAVALGAASLLPADAGKDAFARPRPAARADTDWITPVNLVEWPYPEQSEQEGQARLRPPDLGSEPRPSDAAPEVMPSTPTTSRVTQAAPRLPRPEHQTAERPATAGASEKPPAVLDPLEGGGDVDLGAPTPHGELPGAARGETPLGRPPGPGTGAGGGSGAGAGAGAEQGTGDASGGGAGSGAGAGAAPGGGDGREGFASRLAERRQPAVIHKGALEYPPSAAADGVEGVVRLKVLVTEQGEVAEVAIIQSSRDRRLDAAAIEYVRRWRYHPAVQDGRPRRVYTYAVVAFELR